MLLLIKAFGRISLFLLCLCLHVLFTIATLLAFLGLCQHESLALVELVVLVLILVVLVVLVLVLMLVVLVE